MTMLNNPVLPDQLSAIDSLIACLNSQFDAFRELVPTVHSYVLLERGLDSRLQGLGLELFEGLPRQVLYEGLPEAPLAERLSPWLVQLERQPEADFLHQLCIASQRYGAVSWIWSPLGLRALGDHLRAFMGATLWDEEKNAAEGEIAVRCTDPRVLPGFVEALSDAQRNTLFRPLSAWCLWDRHLTWRCWEGEGEATPPEQPCLRLNTQQLEQLNRHTQPDKILSLLQDNYGDFRIPDNPVRRQLLSRPRDARYRAVHELVEKGRAMGYVTDRDLMLFVALAYTLHHRYFEFPEFSRALAAGRQSGQPLGAVINSLPDAAWQEIDRALAPAEV